MDSLSQTPELANIFKADLQALNSSDAEYLKRVADSVSNGNPIDQVAVMGVSERISEIASAFLEQLRIYLCTDDPVYRDLRNVATFTYDILLSVIAAKISSVLNLPPSIIKRVCGVLLSYLIDEAQELSCSWLSSRTRKED